MSKIIIKREIKSFNPDEPKGLNGNAFLNACEKEMELLSTNQEIIIQDANQVLPKMDVTFSSDDVKDNSKVQLSFPISYTDIKSITEQLLTITRDPLLVTSLLEKLEKDLEIKLAEKNIKLALNSPPYLIAGFGHFIPGPNLEDSPPWHKGRILNDLLLSREKEDGINIDGVIKFISFVKPDISNKFVKNGSIFSESQQIFRVLFHGSYTHRLMWEALRQAVKLNKLNLKLKNGKTLTLKQLLELLVTITIKGNSIWQIVMDSTKDTEYSSKEKPFDVTCFNYSFRSPFVMASTLTCFGKELGLPHLQSYLLDNYYKEAAKLISHTQEELAKKQCSLSNKEIIVSNQNIYLNIMHAFSYAKSFGSIGRTVSFTPSVTEIMANPNYEKLAEGVVKRKVANELIGQYNSWESFYEEKYYERLHLKSIFLTAQLGNSKTNKTEVNKQPIQSITLFKNDRIQADSLKRTSASQTNDGAFVDKFTGIDEFSHFEVNSNQARLFKMKMELPSEESAKKLKP